MSFFSKNTYAKIALVVIGITYSQLSRSETVPIDFSPEQPGRPHIAASQQRIDEVANVPFVKKDTLTIAINTNSSLPLHAFVEWQPSAGSHRFGSIDGSAAFHSTAASCTSTRIAVA